MSLYDDPIPEVGGTKFRNSSIVADAFAAVEGAQKIYIHSKNLWRRNFAFTVSVAEQDALYGEVHAWLMRILPTERHRALLVGSGNRPNRYGEPVADSGSSEEVVPELVVRFDDRDERKVMIDGHKVLVAIHAPELTALNMHQEPEASRIVFTTYTYEGQQAVIGHLDRINREMAGTRKAVLRMVGQWGGWKTRSDIPTRSAASVAIPEEQKERIWRDMERFLSEEDDYMRIGTPWHRSYMFEGPPGTGKTSLFRALFSDFNLDVWYISLSDIKAESNLMSLMSEVGPRSALLLEDLDTIQIARDDVEEDQGIITVGALLNALDGVATPHGMIDAMTTNNFDLLDPRLTREGRMDVIEHIDYPSERTIADLYKHFYGHLPYWAYENEIGAHLELSTKPIEGLSAARVAEQFKKNMHEPAEAAKAAADLVRRHYIKGN